VFATGLGGTVISLIGNSFAGLTTNVSANLLSIWGRSSKDLWVAGSGGMVLHFDGQNWTQNALTTSYDLTAGGLTADGKSLVVGNAGTIFLHDGSAWNPLGVPLNLSDVWGTSDQDVWAVGERVILHQTAAGLQVLPQDEYFSRVWGSSTDNIWAVGSQGSLTHYDGKNWTPWPQKFGRWLYDLCGNSASDIWAVGEAGTVLQVDGEKWEPARKPDSLQSDLYGVWCGGRENVWFVGDQGVAVHYTGSSFVPELVPGNVALRSIWSDGETLYSVGRQGALANRPRDGSWKAQYLSDRKDLLRIYGIAGAAGTESALRIWIAGDQGTLLSLNPGSMTTTPLRYRQQKAFSGTYSGVWAAANRGVWLAGQGGILLHQLSSTP
jgi:hypothetical protein